MDIVVVGLACFSPGAVRLVPQILLDYFAEILYTLHMSGPCTNHLSGLRTLNTFVGDFFPFSSFSFPLVPTVTVLILRLSR